MPKIVFISDTHNKHDRIIVPDGDILVHCGDATIMGTAGEAHEFAMWWKKLPHKHKIFVAGNHDIGWARGNSEGFNGLVENMHGKEFEIMGLKFYGLSWSVEYGTWAYMLPEVQLKHQWENIPKDVDILITHGPPHGILDENRHGLCCGSHSLRQKLTKIHPKIHAFGHIHEAYGKLDHNGTIFVNASTCDRGYQPTNEPIEIEI